MGSEASGELTGQQPSARIPDSRTEESNPTTRSVTQSPTNNGTRALVCASFLSIVCCVDHSYDCFSLSLSLRVYEYITLQKRQWKTNVRTSFRGRGKELGQDIGCENLGENPLYTMERSRTRLKTGIGRRGGKNIKNIQEEQVHSLRADIRCRGEAGGGLTSLGHMREMRVPELHENAIVTIDGQSEIRKTLFLDPNRQTGRGDWAPVRWPVEPKLLGREWSSNRDGGCLRSRCSGSGLLESSSCDEKVLWRWCAGRTATGQ